MGVVREHPINKTSKCKSWEFYNLAKLSADGILRDVEALIGIVFRSHQYYRFATGLVFSSISE